MSVEGFDEKLHFLQATLESALSRLLHEAREKDALLPPYGRPPTPTPFMDEEECAATLQLEGNVTCHTDDAAEDDELDFNYQYGFNPLLFLSEYIHRSHPDSIAKRKQLQRDSMERLVFRAKHALHQQEVAENLRLRVDQLKSGIVHGPLTYPKSPTSVVLICRVASVGKVHIDLSTDSDFETLHSSTVHESLGYEEPLKVSLEGLSPLCKYYCRCHLSRADGAQEDASEDECESTKKSFAHCQFWTLADSSSPPVDLELFVINGQRRGDSVHEASARPRGSFDSSEAKFSVLVGDVFRYEAVEKGPRESHESQLWDLFQHDPLFTALLPSRSANSVLSKSSLLVAWDDSQQGSDTGLKAEEIVHKQWSYDSRKHEKRLKEQQEQDRREPSRKRSLAPPPVLSRPAMSSSFAAMLKGFPLECSEDNVRHFHRSVRLSSEVEAFFLDSRRGYLGREQARWLKEGIRKSSAPMKLLFTGRSFGFPAELRLEEPVELKEEDSELVDSELASKKMSSSRRKALEATKEEFDSDGFSKTSLAHILVSTFHKMYPADQKEDDRPDGGHDDDDDRDDNSHHDENNDDENDDDGSHEERKVRNAEPPKPCKLELSGGIVIVSSSATDESFVAKYAFGRQGQGKSPGAFCLEVGLGQAMASTSSLFGEEIQDSAALISSAREILFRSRGSSRDGSSCSITLKDSGVVSLSLRAVDSGDCEFECEVSSALSSYSSAD